MPSRPRAPSRLFRVSLGVGGGEGMEGWGGVGGRGIGDGTQPGQGKGRMEGVEVVVVEGIHKLDTG